MALFQLPKHVALDYHWKVCSISELDPQLVLYMYASLYGGTIQYS